MQIGTIVSLVTLGVVTLGGIVTIIVAIIRGDMKKFIEEKMIEAEKLEMTGREKLAYVLEAVKEKYKLMEVVMNVRKFIEHIIEISKNINSK